MGRKKDKDKLTLKREKWNRFGYVNVARRGGKIISWEKWSRKEGKTLNSFLSRKSKKKPRLNPNVVSYTSYSKINKIITKKPIMGEVGQVMIKLEARKGNQRAVVDGFSLLNDASRSKKTFNKMVDQAQKSAYAKLPFSPDTMRITDIKFIYYVEKKGR